MERGARASCCRKGADTDSHVENALETTTTTDDDDDDDDDV